MVSLHVGQDLQKQLNLLTCISVVKFSSSEEKMNCCNTIIQTRIQIGLAVSEISLYNERGQRQKNYCLSFRICRVFFILIPWLGFSLVLKYFQVVST